jgi:hypothetical protein
MTKRVFQIYRYDPDTDAKPRMQTIGSGTRRQQNACCWTR